MDECSPNCSPKKKPKIIVFSGRRCHRLGGVTAKRGWGFLASFFSVRADFVLAPLSLLPSCVLTPFVSSFSSLTRPCDRWLRRAISCSELASVCELRIEVFLTPVNSAAKFGKRKSAGEEDGETGLTHAAPLDCSCHPVAADDGHNGRGHIRSTELHIGFPFAIHELRNPTKLGHRMVGTCLPSLPASLPFSLSLSLSLSLTQTQTHTPSLFLSGSSPFSCLRSLFVYFDGFFLVDS